MRNGGNELAVCISHTVSHAVPVDLDSKDERLSNLKSCRINL